jgi:hypothetical protein
MKMLLNRVGDLGLALEISFLLFGYKTTNDQTLFANNSGAFRYRSIECHRGFNAVRHMHNKLLQKQALQAIRAISSYSTVIIAPPRAKLAH